MKIHPRSFPPGQGFSLVEVALAVAIAALGIITCLGLLPEGLEMSRKTATLAINSNILEQIIRDIENANGWKTIKSTYSTPTNFPDAGAGATSAELLKTYDYQGTPVKNDDPDMAFLVSIDNDDPCYLPGATTDQPNLARLVIRIANTQNTKFSFTDVKNKGKFETFYHLVAKSR